MSFLVEVVECGLVVARVRCGSRRARALVAEQAAQGHGDGAMSFFRASDGEPLRGEDVAYNKGKDTDL